MNMGIRGIKKRINLFCIREKWKKDNNSRINEISN